MGEIIDLNFIRQAREAVKRTSIPGLFVVGRPVLPDERGFFREVFRLSEIEAVTGVKFNHVQMNHSYSQPGVIRALHAENWNKLVYPVSGQMFTAIVDIRPESETFGKVETFTFDNSNRRALFISQGLANSVCVIGEEPVHYIYLVDAYYDGKDTRAVAWDDPDLKIPWPVTTPIISEKDQQNPTLRELFPEKFK